MEAQHNELHAAGKIDEDGNPIANRNNIYYDSDYDYY